MMAQPPRGPPTSLRKIKSPSPRIKIIVRRTKFRTTESSKHNDNNHWPKASPNQITKRKERSTSTSVSIQKFFPQNTALHYDHRKEILMKGYQLKSIIGSGSYAHVFRGKDLKNDRDVAIKLIELDKCSKHYKEVCLRNEIYVIRELQHENIIRFYEAFNTTMAYVMVMELAENGTFADYLHRNGATPEERAKRLFRGVFFAMDYMHKKLIAHRDLKLENLMLNKNLEPKIVDFSLSVIWDGKKLLNDWCGTPPYFAPEIIQRKPYDPLGYDVWSLGVCIYIMLNDAIPFMCTDEQEQLQKQLNRDWKFRPKFERLISEELKLILRSMLEPEPHLRLRMNQLLRTKWVQAS